MGLLYPLPISTDEKDFVHFDENHKTITLKSYGLPYVFWFYALASFIVYSLMMFGVSSTLQALLNSTDQIDQTLALSFLVFTISLPIIILAFFFYQKVVIADHAQNKMYIIHKAFGLTYKKKVILFNKQIELQINHYLDSPNMARIQQGEDMRGFKNKGYFLLEAIEGKEKFLVDRSSSKTDLKKIMKLLSLGTTYKNTDDHDSDQ